MTHRFLGVLAAAALAASACSASPLPFDFIHHGHFQKMMHSGDSGGRVRLADLPQAPGTWGLGAVAGLTGEIVQLDGRILVSHGHDPEGRVQPAQADEQATLFASAQVHAWVDIPLPADMDQAGFEAFVAEQAERLGLSLRQPFAFRVEGRFPRLRWHVLNGEAATKADAHGHRQAHGAHGGHTNHRAGMNVFHQPGSTGQLIGIYSGAELEGAVSHPGERFHLHFVDAGVTVSGHVDGYAVAGGSILRLPKP